MLRFVTLCCAGCLVSGCFTSSAIYPEHWAERRVSHDRTCPNIDGNYGDSGESLREDGFSGHEIAEARSLAHILNGGTGSDSLALWNKLGVTTSHPDADANAKVRLALADDRLRVTAVHADGGSRSMELPVRAGCRDGLLALESDWDNDIELISPAAPELSRKSIALGRAADGSLLVRESKSAAQFFLFTPVFGYREAAWIRFEEVPAVIAPVAEATP